jgi:hypothetical protein
MIAVPSKEAVGIPDDVLDQHSESNPNACNRLDSWKEIAAYLRRSVRCVQRWERAEGLPVLRHQHAKGATVYAYRHEVDQWREEGKTIMHNSARTNGKDGQFLGDRKCRLQRIELPPDAQEEFAFLLQNVLRTIGRGPGPVLQRQSRRGG